MALERGLAGMYRQYRARRFGQNLCQNPRSKMGRAGRRRFGSHHNQIGFKGARDIDDIIRNLLVLSYVMHLTFADIHLRQCSGKTLLKCLPVLFAGRASLICHRQQRKRRVGGLRKRISVSHNFDRMGIEAGGAQNIPRSPRPFRGLAG
jgi:hypothetical protein